MTYAFGIVPGRTFNAYWVLPGAPKGGKSIEIHASVVKNQGSKELRPRWVWDAARVDFLIDFGLLLGGPGTFFLMCWGFGERLEIFKLKFAGGGGGRRRGEGRGGKPEGNPPPLPPSRQSLLGAPSRT